MTRSSMGMFVRRWGRPTLVALGAIVFVALVVALVEDARDLAGLGASLGRREAALDATLTRAVGGVLQHFALRTTAHAVMLLGLVAAAATLQARAALRRGGHAP